MLWSKLISVMSEIIHANVYRFCPARSEPKSSVLIIYQLGCFFFIRKECTISWFVIDIWLLRAAGFLKDFDRCLRCRLRLELRGDAPCSCWRIHVLCVCKCFIWFCKLGVGRRPKWREKWHFMFLCISVAVSWHSLGLDTVEKALLTCQGRGWITHFIQTN